MPWLDPITLSGTHATLEPLSPQHWESLATATRDGELWKLPFTRVPSPEGMRLEIERRLGLQSQGTMLPFAVLDAEGVASGMTTFMNIDATNRRLEIGSTWYAQRVQRTALNTECKLLLLTHAFETLNCIAVEFRTSHLNLPSQRAIERLGAKRDGILRCHQHHCDGTLRDTYVYSIVASEWPESKARLALRLVNNHAKHA